MPSTPELLNRLSAQPLELILSQLHQLRKRFNAGDRINLPLVTLYLQGGQVLKGSLIDISHKQGRGWVLFQDASRDQRVASFNLHYLAIDMIGAITLHDAEQVVEALSFGEVAIRISPSRLEIKRTLVELTQTLSTLLDKSLTANIAWDSITLDDNSLIVLADLIVDAFGALTEIGQDDFGRQVLAESLQRLSFETSTDDEISFKNGEMKFSRHKLSSGRWPRLQMLTTIKALL